MFQQLDLKNFRQHEELSLTFERGVVAIRGRNEQGKTSILESIAYAMGGATCLREPLEDVVTWGKKVGELKVKLDFHLNGVDYRILRSKSGAEIRTAERILATGQKEVTRYVETLLGASMDVCQKLMLASQDDIKGALSKGPGAAVELIEALSNLGVIDTIIGLVQDQLPCGTTTSVVARLQTLEQQAELPVQDDTGPLVEQLADAREDEMRAEDDYKDTKAAYGATVTDADRAQRLLDTAQRLASEEGRLSTEHARAQTALAGFTVPAVVSDTEIEELRRTAQDAGRLGRAAVAKRELEALPAPENEWDESLEALQALRAEHARAIGEMSSTINDSRVLIAQKRAMKITQTACGLCGKDLSQVPEVATKNANLDADITAEEARIAEAQAALTSAKETVEACDGILRHHNTRQAVYARHAEWITLDTALIPHRWSWSGPTEFTVTGNPAKALADAEAAQRSYHAALGRKQQLETALAEVTVRYGEAKVARAAAESETAGCQQVLEVSAAALQRLNAAQGKLETARRGVQTARHALEGAQAVLRERQAARAALTAQILAARAELAEMDDNNALVKFLREARPTVADQLWGMVMSTVSIYFSEIRGTPSVVTRSDNGFKVDGRNVAGLSGSTKDALGLAIRAASTKTFLPNTSFLVLDEASAACDNERTAAMAGMIAASGFEQVLWVTHDDIVADVATQLISLEA